MDSSNVKPPSASSTSASVPTPAANTFWGWNIDAFFLADPGMPQTWGGEDFQARPPMSIHGVAIMRLTSEPGQPQRTTTSIWLVGGNLANRFQCEGIMRCTVDDRTVFVFQHNLQTGLNRLYVFVLQSREEALEMQQCLRHCLQVDGITMI